MTIDLNKKRKYHATVKFNEEERDKLWYLCRKWDATQTQVIRYLIDEAYEAESKNEREGNNGV